MIIFLKKPPCSSSLSVINGIVSPSKRRAILRYPLDASLFSSKITGSPLLEKPITLSQGFANAVAGADEAIVVSTPEISAVRDADRVVVDQSLG